ncbi:MFS general substrate transporter [Penicillium lagena]|uniref:MFS general substrate transporter n=1 Tax=Penicillium lagena TaxID=94218 RepID=UPI002541DB94|nr:MFS general substrate transporter [Penicillium lagena]KAJ5611165.1 MFS general substrate transporter [Penicillium lagena]
MSETFNIARTHSAIEAPSNKDDVNGIVYAPGTVLLENIVISESHLRTASSVILQPKPTVDPNDPLNWSLARKSLNFGITAFYTLLIFGLIDIGPVVWQDFERLLGITYPELNDQYAVNCASLGIGSIMLIPLALKFGRRPVYLLTSLVVFITAVWQAVLRDFTNMVAVQIFNGFACAVSWTLVPITITDLFFVHQRGRVNAIYQLMLNGGTFLAPVAAGYIADTQGWPWIFWWTAIFLGLNLALFVFCFEESKFKFSSSANAISHDSASLGGRLDFDTYNHDSAERINLAIALRTYRQRMALLTRTPGDQTQYWNQLYEPVSALFKFPAVTYVMLSYSSLLVWFTVIATTQSEFFALEPYRFGTAEIGLLNIPPFIGAVLGCVWGGPISDWSIQRLSIRNNGVYEPEMRLYIAILPALIGPAGILLYGYSLAKGMPWIWPCLGSGLYSFSMAGLLPISLTFLIDSYSEIIGSALVGVNFVQYMFATIVIFALDPWIQGMGLQNTFILIGCLAFLVNLLCIPMIWFGKRWRIACRGRYEKMAARQFDDRI